MIDYVPAGGSPPAGFVLLTDLYRLFLYICAVNEFQYYRTMYKNRIIYTLSLLLLLSSDLLAEWNHFVTNYKKELFGKGSQTWQIKAFNENWIYFGNKNGLLQYDGSEWNRFPIHNETDVRSVFVSEKLNRIYVGGDSEFGYFTPNASGNLQYVNLSDSLPPTQRFNGAYWGVYHVENLFYYVADWVVVKQYGDEFSLVPSVGKIDCSAVINSTLYIGTTKGVFVLVGNKFFPLSGGDKLIGKHIRSIAPYQSGMLVATALDGLYYVEGTTVTPLVTGAEAFLRSNEVFSMAVSGNMLAIGTVRRGLVLVNLQNHKIKFYNERNGLQNNTVLSIAFDKRNNLWLGLDNGIDYISLDTPFTTLYTYPYSSGAGYASVIYKGFLYLGTNSGVYRTSWPVRFGELSAEIEFIPQLSGQVWDLKEIDGKLFCMHDKGLYILDGKTIESVPGLRGMWTCTKSPGNPSKLWAGGYEGMYVLEKVADKWRVKAKLEGVNDWFKNFEFESPEVAWIRNTSEGPLRIEIDTVAFKVTRSRFYTLRDGLKSTRNLYISKLGKTLYFSTDSGLYTYNAGKDKMELSSAIPQSFPHSILKQYGDSVIGLDRNGIGVLKFNKEGRVLSSMMFPINHKQMDFIRYYETFQLINDSTVIIPNEYGFSLLDLTYNKPKEDNNELFIKKVYTSFPKDILLYSANFMGMETVPEIEYKNNSLRFEYTLHAFDREKSVMYRYRLSPNGSWSEPSASESKEFSNLREGSYTFELESIDSAGSVSQTSFSFVILPPWYRSMWAYFVYFMFLLVIAYFVYRLDEWRIRRKKLLELAEKEKAMRLKEEQFIKTTTLQENEIMRLNNEKLQYELKHKSQEMANLTINFVRKNEILTDIKENLFKVMEEMRGEPFVKVKRMLVNVNSRIDSNMQSDDLLKRFEEQFDLVHNNFMTKLSERHPDLTLSERKMCAFLKMDLSSKEMAPLLNISVRGVEAMRYRLRKRIGLEREINLLEYLNSIE